MEEAIAYVQSLTHEQKAALSETIVSSRLGIWAPSPGPQSLAYYSEADEVFYGGAAGGGKSSLIIGLALTQHRRSLILRRESTQLRGMVDDIARLLGSRDGLNKQDGQWRVPPEVSPLQGPATASAKTDTAHLIEFGGVPNPGDEERHQGIPHDLLAFDEVTQLPEYIIDYLSTWNRSTDPSQRCRIVLTSNPPTPSTAYSSSSTGLWLIRRYAPWLDPQYSDPLFKGPAKPGELRWYVTLDGKEREHPDGEPFEITIKEGPFKGSTETILPKSRTFIPARVGDNPYLSQTNYEATLQKLPEPLRSAMLYGDFSVSLSDKPLQLLPTEWVRAATARWELQSRANPPPTAAPNEQTALGVDVSRGGGDKTVILPRYGSFIDKPIEIPSQQTLNGATVAAKIVEHRRDNAAVVVDANGVGASVYDHLRNNTSIGDTATLRAYVGSERSLRRDRSGRYGFPNLRSQAYWMLREALDPANNPSLAIPPDDDLVQELLVLTWKEESGRIRVMTKEEVIKQLGRSPDKADPLAMVWTILDENAQEAREASSAREDRLADADGAKNNRAFILSRRPRWSDRADRLPYPSRE